MESNFWVSTAFPAERADERDTPPHSSRHSKTRESAGKMDVQREAFAVGMGKGQTTGI